MLQNSEGVADQENVTKIQTSTKNPVNDIPDIDGNAKFLEKSKKRIKLLDSMDYTVPAKYKDLN